MVNTDFSARFALRRNRRLMIRLVKVHMGTVLHINVHSLSDGSRRDTPLPILDKFHTDCVPTLLRLRKMA